MAVVVFAEDLIAVFGDEAIECIADEWWNDEGDNSEYIPKTTERFADVLECFDFCKKGTL